jgi:hypothetical protein
VVVLTGYVQLAGRFPQVGIASGSSALRITTYGRLTEGQ